jgi:hypothetical protein
MPNLTGSQYGGLFYLGVNPLRRKGILLPEPVN